MARNSTDEELVGLPKPEAALVNTKDLNFDPEVQRSLDQQVVNRMIADFDAGALGTITVNRRESKQLFVIDGQHRVVTVTSIPDAEQEMFAMLYAGLSIRQEAALFRRLNNSRKVQPLDKFRIRLKEEDPVALALHSMFVKYGWRLGSGSATGSFSAVSALEGIYFGPRRDQTRIELCESTISVVTGAWGLENFGVKAEILQGVSALLDRYGDEVNMTRLTSKLAKTEGGPRSLWARARGLKNLRGGRLGNAVAEIVVTEYNSGGGKKIPLWQW